MELLDCAACQILVWCYMLFEFVVGSRLAPRVLSGYSGFPPSTKTNISEFQFVQERGPAGKPAKADVASKN